MSSRRMAIILLGVAIAIVIMPDIAWVLFANGKGYEFARPYAVMCGLLPSLILLLLLFALLARKLWIGALLLLPFLLLAPIETAYIYHYGEPTWYAIIATIAESNSRETIDYLGNALWALVAACLFALGAGVAAVVLLRRTGTAWTGRSRVLALTIAMSCTAVMVVFALAPSRKAGAAAAADPDAPSLLEAKSMQVSFPFGMPLRLLQWYREQQAIEDNAAALRQFRFHARIARPVKERQVYVLIIGEASRVDRWSLFGYERDTNPRLEQTPNLVRLANVVTPWSASRMAIPIIVSRKKGSDGHGNFGEPSVLRAFSEAGFDTYWISNQIAFGGYDSPISVLARDAQHVSFHNVADYTNPGTYDGVLLDPFKQALQSGSDKLFIVLHTLGSHQNYAYRYPPEYDRYTPSLKHVAHPDIDNLAQATEISNSYDNSILYTDRFIADVIATVSATSAVSTVWYVADHGEDLINASCRLTAHGSGTVYNFRVPSVFWYSPSYATEFPDGLKQFLQHSKEPVSTENLFESLIDMAGLQFPGHDAAWSLFSDQWQPHQRIVNPLYGQARLDFDHAGESKNCHMLTPEPANALVNH